MLLGGLHLHEGQVSGPDETGATGERHSVVDRNHRKIECLHERPVSDTRLNPINNHIEIFPIEIR